MEQGRKGGERKGGEQRKIYSSIKKEKRDILILLWRNHLLNNTNKQASTNMNLMPRIIPDYVIAENIPNCTVLYAEVHEHFAQLDS